ncbi:MAG TPA: chromate efflux transporter [Verrucomicrobiae bacterium]|nr:chromate efflux transporter [Verrucomicrobiae bacterium]
MGPFLKLGLISFGGPVAHLAYFREEFVRRRAWLSDLDYADLVALCQSLPGPASSQVVFALGMRRAGWPGALAAAACFTTPSAILMILCARFVTAAGDLSKAGWLHGLKLTAVAVVAQAVWGMGRSLCPDWPRVALAVAASAMAMAFPSPATPVFLIAIGTLAGWLLYRHAIPQAEPAADHSARKETRAGAFALGLFILLLVGLPPLAAVTGNHAVALFDSFYRSGSLVFGGGHVVLPLLRAEMATRGWVSDDALLAGYGLAQAVPGPLFTFAAYLGAMIHGPSRAWLGGLWCLLGIFLPGWLLIGGVLPFWSRLRNRAWSRAALHGANAVVVGLLFAAFCHPVWTEGVHDFRDALAAALLWTLLNIFRVPAWAVVTLAGAAGQWMSR